MHSPLALLGVPSAVLTGLAFAVPIAALVGVADEDMFNPLFRFGITPMFLFSGTFFPVTQLPRVPRARVRTPLWHGVDLMRHLALGAATIGWSAISSSLLAWAAGGFFLARGAYRKTLVV